MEWVVCTHDPNDVMLPCSFCFLFSAEVCRCQMISFFIQQPQRDRRSEPPSRAMARDEREGEPICRAMMSSCWAEEHAPSLLQRDQTDARLAQ